MGVSVLPGATALKRIVGNSITNTFANCSAEAVAKPETQAPVIGLSVETPPVKVIEPADWQQTTQCPNCHQR